MASGSSGRSFLRVLVASAAVAGIGSGCAGILGVEEISVVDGEADAPVDGPASDADPCALPGSCVDAARDAPQDVDANLPPAPPVANPQLWLDARKEIAGTATTSWSDHSGNGAHAVGTLAIPVVANAINGRPGLRFTGEVTQTMRVAAEKLVFKLDDGFTIFVVAKMTVPPDLTLSTVLRRATSPNQNGIWLMWYAPTSYLVSTTLFSYASPMTYDVGASHQGVSVVRPHVYAIRVGDGELQFTVDGRPASSSSTLNPTNPDFATVNTAPLAIAGKHESGAAGEYFTGDLGSVIVYTRKLSPDELASASKSLMQVWGIP